MITPLYENVHDHMTFSDTAECADLAERAAYRSLLPQITERTRQMSCFMAREMQRVVEEREDLMDLYDDLLSDDFTADLITVPTEITRRTRYRIELTSRDWRSYDLRDLLDTAERHNLDLLVESKYHGKVAITFVPRLVDEDEDDE